MQECNAKITLRATLHVCMSMCSNSAASLPSASASLVERERRSSNRTSRPARTWPGGTRTERGGAGARRRCRPGSPASRSARPLRRPAPPPARAGRGPGARGGRGERRPLCTDHSLTSADSTRLRDRVSPAGSHISHHSSGPPLRDTRRGGSVHGRAA